MSRKCLVSIGTALVALLVSRVGLSQVGFKATPLIQTTRTEVGQDIRYPSAHAQITTLLLEIAPGGTNRPPYASGPRRELCVGRRSNHRA